MKVAIRADASVATGLGHVMRCLALADELCRQGAQVSFVARSLAGQVARWITERGHGLELLPGSSPPPGPEPSPAGPGWEEDAEQTLQVLNRNRGVDWLVVDHYALDAHWQRRVRDAADKLLVIDDLANRPHDADLLLDQNLCADGAQRYRPYVSPDCRLLLGPRHALLRPDFAALHRIAAVRRGEVRRLLVLLGGTDAANHTGLVLDALDLLKLAPEVAVDVVIGGAHPARERLVQRCRLRPATTLHVDSTEVAALMAQADLSIGAGGSTTWERCALGLPALGLCIAENQREVLAQAALQGLLVAPTFNSFNAPDIALHLAALIANPALREMVSSNGLTMVDGQGARRVAEAMLSPRTRLQWRYASLNDAEALLAWRNHESVRLASHQREPIDLVRHRAWLASVIANPNRHLLIGSLDGQPVGVVRFDVRGDSAEVSIYRVPGMQEERSLGRLLLASAQDWLRAQRPSIRTLVAEVLADNEASWRLFEAAGYRLQMHRYIKSLD